jgi:drug/metabolite transporter (DMT)-like permease
LKLVLLLALLWGGSYPLLKIAVETIPPLTTAAARAAVAATVLLVVLGRRGPELWRMAKANRDLWVQSFFNCILPWTLVAWASTAIASGLVTILNSLSPIFVFLFTWAVTRHESAPLRKFVGVVLGLAGVIVIVGIDALRGLGAHTLAEVACVVGSVSYGLATVMGRRYEGVSPLFPAAGTVAIAAVALAPFAIVGDWMGSGPLPQPSLRSMVALVASGIFSTALGFIVYFRLLATLGPIATSAQAYLRIGIGVGIGVLFLGETLRPEVWIGLLLVMAGVVAMVKPVPR